MTTDYINKFRFEIIQKVDQQFLEIVLELKYIHI